MGYLEKAEDSFFFTGLTGYRDKPEEDDSFFLDGLMGYLEKGWDEKPFFLSGTVGTGTLFWNCWGYG